MCKMRFLNNRLNKNLNNYKVWLQINNLKDTMQTFDNWADNITYNRLLKNIGDGEYV